MYVFSHTYEAGYTALDITYTAESGIGHINIYLDADRQWCVVSFGDNRYRDVFFVGSVAEEYDPVALLTKVLPWTATDFALQMNCTVVSRFGEILTTDGRLNLRGETLEHPFSGKGISFSALSLAGIDFSRFTGPYLYPLEESEYDGFTKLHAIYPTDEGVGNIIIYLDSKKQWCVISMGEACEDGFFVGSAAEEYDPIEILNNALPWEKTKLELQMHCTAVSRTGEVLAKGPLSLDASLLEKPLGTRCLLFSALNLAGIDFSELTDTRLFLTVESGNDGFTVLRANYPVEGGVRHIVIYLDNGKQWCVISAGGEYEGTYFVGSAAEEYDPVEILSKCRIILE